MAGKPKLVRDIVYGYVDLAEEVLDIIDTRYFQRLKRIRQLTAFCLYPSANQTRFEHSIGVMHLGRRVIESLGKCGDLRYIVENSKMTEDTLRRSVEYACLLHDIGHAPFSHLGERFFDRQTILDEIKSLSHEISLSLSAGSKHELMSCLVILKHFREKLPAEVSIDLVCRMITKSFYEPIDSLKCLNPIISILNSQYDVDRLDYVLRDSITTGTLGVSIDYVRLVSGYRIKENTLLFDKKAIPSVVHLITGRDFLYQWLYNHHVVAYTDLCVEEIIKRQCDDNEKGRLFSLKAIENNVADEDVWCLLKKCEQNDDVLARRLFSRQFHKTVWKTPYEFVTTQGISSTQKEKIVSYLCPQNRKNIDAKKIIQYKEAIVRHLGTNDPDSVLVVDRYYKPFNPTENRSVSFWIDDKSLSYADIAGPSSLAEGASPFPFIFYDPGIDKEDVIQAIVSALC